MGSYNQGFDHYNNWWVGSSRCLSTTAELGQVMNCNLPLAGCDLSFHYTGDSESLHVPGSGCSVFCNDKLQRDRRATRDHELSHDERERPHIRGWSKEEWWRGTRLRVRSRRGCIECVAYEMRCRGRAASLPSARRVELPDGGRSDDHDRWGGAHVQRFPHRSG